MKTTKAARKSLRLPGEMAFDRCFLPLVAVSVIRIVFQIIDWKSYPTEPNTEAFLDAQMPPPLWNAWMWFALGLLLAGLWLRALVTLAQAWHDPSSRVLRFPSLVLLIPFAVATCQLLRSPFQ